MQTKSERLRYETTDILEQQLDSGDWGNIIAEEEEEPLEIMDRSRLTMLMSTRIVMGMGNPRMNRDTKGDTLIDSMQQSLKPNGGYLS